MQLGAVGAVLFVISYHTAAQRRDCLISGGERVTSVNISWLKLVCDSPSEIIASFDRLRLRLRLVPPSQPRVQTQRCLSLLTTEDAPVMGHDETSGF